MTLGRSHSGLPGSGGSSAVTSSAAPARCPARSSWMSAPSSMTRPRPTFTTIAPAWQGAQYLGVYHAEGVRRFRQRDHQDVGPGSEFGEPVRGEVLVNWRFWLFPAGVDPDDMHSGGLGELGDAGADGAGAEYQRGASGDVPHRVVVPLARGAVGGPPEAVLAAVVARIARRRQQFRLVAHLVIG